MKANRLIAIITVVRNDLAGLIRTADSIFRQKVQNFEWIIIDGDSIDGTKNYLDSLKRESFVTAISEKDNGIYDAMNKGIALAQCEYVLFLNAGDIVYDSDVLSVVMRVIQSWSGEEKGIAILCGGYYFEFPNGTRLQGKVRSADYIWYGMPTSHQAMFFPLPVLQRYPYDLRYRYGSDYCLVATAHKNKVPFKVLDYPISVYRVGGASFQNPLQAFKESVAIRRRVLNGPIYLVVVSAVWAALKRIGFHILTRLKG